MTDFDQLDRVVHEPARLAIMTVLAAVERADFLFLIGRTRLTRGNLSSHCSKLAETGYIEIEKQTVDGVPRTLYRLTAEGRQALDSYRSTMALLLSDADDRS